MYRLASYLIIFIITHISLMCFSQATVSDSTYSKIFWLAAGKLTRNDTTFQTVSTAPMYVVVTVSDFKTGETKEICVEYNYLEGAINKDSGNAYIDTRNRVFKFKSDNALNNVGFFDFDIIKYNACIKEVTAEKMLKEWNEDNTNFSNKYSGDCQKYYAYLLFKNGIMTRRGSIVGDISIMTEEHLKKHENYMKHSTR